MTNLTATAGEIQALVEDNVCRQINNDALSFDPGNGRKYLAIPDGVRLESLEKYEDRPRRFNGTFSTHNITEFVAYVEEHAIAGDTRVFVATHPDKLPPLEVTSIIDLGGPAAPEWGTHRAELNLRVTPCYREAHAMFDEGMGQMRLVDWLEDWGAEHIAVVNSVEVDDSGRLSFAYGTLAECIKALRSVSLKEITEADFERENLSYRKTAMESVEARSKAGDLPAGFVLNTPVLEGTNDRELFIRLRLRTGHGSPAFTMKPVRLSDMMEDVAREVMESIGEGIDQDMIHVGRWSGTSR